jgi:hypothetical protein
MKTKGSYKEGEEKGKYLNTKINIKKKQEMRNKRQKMEQQMNKQG